MTDNPFRSETMPPSLKRDIQKLAYDRTIEMIQRTTDTFENNSDVLALVTAQAMRASFMMLYTAARIAHDDAPLDPHDLLRMWENTSKEEFARIVQGYDMAKAAAEETLFRSANLPAGHA